MPKIFREGRSLDQNLVPIPTPLQQGEMRLENQRIAQKQARIKQGFASQSCADHHYLSPPVAGHDFAREG